MAGAAAGPWSSVLDVWGSADPLRVSSFGALLAHHLVDERLDVQAVDLAVSVEVAGRPAVVIDGQTSGAASGTPLLSQLA